MALTTFGTNTTFDLLKNSTQTIAQFGEDRAWDATASLLDSYNARMRELMSTMVDRTTNRLRRYGATSAMKMQRTDQMGTTNPQKGGRTAVVGFPLEKYEISIQWNRLWMKRKKARELADLITQVTTASVRARIGLIKAALFGGINYNFTDYLVDNLDEQFALPVKALVNGDGAPIPPGPNGESFAGTHNHYLAVASLNNTWATALIDTVIEHNDDGDAVVWIAYQDASLWAGLADFKPLAYEYVEKAIDDEYGRGTKSKNKLRDRQIGWFNGAEIWVKPFIDQYYSVAWMRGENRQPLAMRVRGENADGGEEVEGAGDLTLVFQDESHPLRAEGWEEEYGIGVWWRTNAAVGYANGSTYVIPNMTGWF